MRFSRGFALLFVLSPLFGFAVPDAFAQGGVSLAARSSRYSGVSLDFDERVDSSGTRCIDGQRVMEDSLQVQVSSSSAGGTESSTEQGQPQTTPAPKQCQTQSGNANAQQPASEANSEQPPPEPKRILGVMPNFRAVTAGTLPPPPTPKESFKIATENSFDYSALIFVGITSFMAEASNAHPDLGKGIAGFGRYYWRGFVDKTDGNYLVIFALPTVFHQDERYYAKEKGPVLKRGIYAASRILITPNYSGHPSFNASELLGRAMAQGISASYYPSADRTLGALAERWGYALGRDALTNVFREFWPDIAVHVLHRHP